MRRIMAILSALLFASGAAASDGVLEINQTCAVETGCFAGDTPGFPVTIDGTAGKSYRLSSDLAIATDVNGIFISSSYVTLDLGGFEIAGPGSCTGTSLSLDCGGTGAGVGIVGLDVLYGVTVRNGVVRNMRLDGVGVGGAGSLGVRIEGITARHNARLGISGQDGVLARNCVAIENGNNGFDLDAGSVVQNSTAIGNFGHGVEIDDAGGVVSGTTSRSNAGRGFNVVAGSKFGKNNLSTANGSPDSCGGGICTDRKRIYITSSQYNFTTMYTACDQGFRNATFDELSTGSYAGYVHDSERGTASGLLAGEIIMPGSRSDGPGFGIPFTQTRGGGFSQNLVPGVSDEGVFRCTALFDDANEGVICDADMVRNLTPGWKEIKGTVIPVTTARVMCVEED